MSSLNSPVTREELQNLLVESHRGLRSELDLAVSPNSPRALRVLQQAAIQESVSLYREVADILALAPERIETEEDLTPLCEAVRAAVERATDTLKSYKPETYGRSDVRKKEARIFDEVPRAFRNALRKARSVLKDRETTVDFSSTTQLPESGLEVRD